MDDFIPKDNKLCRRFWEAYGKGSCGPSIIATILKKNIEDIINEWSEEYRGYATVKEMRKILERHGYKTKFIGGRKSKVFPIPETRLAIVRISWSRNSHFVMMKRWSDGEWWVFCNAYGWFKRESLTAKKYLENGYISSYLELTRRW